jgi:outer membrane lipoprotein-sorting protein
MNNITYRVLPILALVLAALFLAACGEQPGGTNVNTTQVNTNAANANANSAANSDTSAALTVETREPDEYEAVVLLKFEAIGGGQTTALPNLSAVVARNGEDRRMEFTMPAGGRVVFLDKAGTNYLVLPDRKQYALLDKESMGFEVRRMLMPEQIVQQVKNVRGVQMVGEEQYNGRNAMKYRYEAVADTRSQAGLVETESFLIVDKETGLPLRSETVSRSTSGGNLQGYSGLRVVTEMNNIKTSTSPGIFDEPTGLEKVDSAQVRAQVDMVFNSIAAFLTQVMNQNQPGSPGSTPGGTPAVTPAR